MTTEAAAEADVADASADATPEAGTDAADAKTEA